MVYMQDLIADGEQIDGEYSEKACKMIDIDYDDVLDCVKNSFETPGNKTSDNKILKEDIQWRAKQQVMEHPAITINNQTYQGNFNGRDVVMALCHSFKTRPEVCKNNSIETHKGQSRDYNNYDKMFVDNTELYLEIAGGLIIALNIVGVLYHRRRSQNQGNRSMIQNEVN